MKNARFLLHLLLITALSAALYPFPLLLAIWSGSAGWTAPVMTAALVLCVWLGTLYILLLRRQYARHPRWVNGGVWALTLLLCVLGSLFAPYPTRLAQVLLGIAGGCCFFGGARLVFHPLEHLVHPNVFVGLCLWDCFSGFLIYLTGERLPFLPMVLLFAANAALFALVHNRDAMERMLSGRDGDTWELPTEIRRSNGRLMGILCGVGLALVLCSRPLARGMRWLWRWIYTGFFYALRWLLSLGSSSDTAEEIPESARDKLMELPQNSTSGWVRLVIELVLLAAVLALVIWKRHEIGDAIATAWLSLRQWLRSHLQKNHAAQENQNGGAYCDYVEDLLYHEKTAVDTVTLQSRRNWKKASRRYHRLPHGAERFRLGYALLLAKLPDDAARPADSPAEILEHLQILLPEESSLSQWETVTQAYSALRYGEIQPEENAFLAMDALLKQQK